MVKAFVSGKNAACSAAKDCVRTAASVSCSSGTRSQMNPGFAGQVVVVTGAARGIGAVIAKHFAGAGARLVLSDIDEKGLGGVAESIAATGSDLPVTKAGDLSREDIAADVIK